MMVSRHATSSLLYGGYREVRWMKLDTGVLLRWALVAVPVVGAFAPPDTILEKHPGGATCRAHTPIKVSRRCPASDAAGFAYGSFSRRENETVDVPRPVGCGMVSRWGDGEGLSCGG